MSSASPRPERLCSPGSARVLLALTCVLIALGVVVLETPLDRIWMLGMHADTPSAIWTIAWSSITVLGLGWSALILVLAADRRMGRITAALVPAFIVGGLVTHVLKRLFAISRPAGTDIAAQLHVIGQTFRAAVSMPSGHSVTIAAAAVLLWAAAPRLRSLAALLLATLIALVALSRVAVGAHWPSDVLVGAGLGVLVGCASLLGDSWRATRGLYERFAALVGTTAGQCCVALVEFGATAGLLKETRAYPAARPMVVALAAMAIGSGIWRVIAAIRNARRPRGPGGDVLVNADPPGAPQPASDAAAAARRRAMLHLARLGLTLAVCVIAWAWLLRHVDLAALAAQIGTLPPWAWFLGGATLLAGHACRALRLRTEWSHIHVASWWQCLRIVLAHNALVLMLPLRSGEAGYLVAVRSQWGVGWATAGLALLRWRIQDVAVLAILAAVLLAPATLPVRLLLAVAAAALLHFAFPPFWSWLLARRGAATAAMPSGRSLWSGIGASAANWTLKVIANGGLLAALTGLPLETALRAALGGELGGVQPLQPPAGLGVYEGGIWLAAHLPASYEARVVAAALAVHAFSLAVALGAAGIAQLASTPPHARSEPAS